MRVCLKNKQKQNQKTHICKQTKQQQNKTNKTKNLNKTKKPQQPVLTLGDTSQPLCAGSVASTQDHSQMTIPDLESP